MDNVDTVELLRIVEQKRNELRERDAFIEQFAFETEKLRSEYLEALRNLVDALGIEMPVLPSNVRLAMPSPAHSQSHTSTEMTESVLLKAGHPLHVNEIMSGIERDFGVSVRYATLVGNLSRMVAKGKTFERSGRNIFGLLRWHEEQERDHEAKQLFGEE